MDASPRLIVGLGNPTDEYKKTRHNVGREFINEITRDLVSYKMKIRQADMVRLPDFFGVNTETPIFLATFKCYMNESGGPVRKIMVENGLTPADLLVIVDDFMIPFGALRLRPNGSAGGHNGLKSIIATLGTEEFGRLRIGVGPVPPSVDPADYVLKKFTKKEWGALPDVFKKMSEGLKTLMAHGYQKAMGEINKQHLSGIEHA